MDIRQRGLLLHAWQLNNCENIGDDEDECKLDEHGFFDKKKTRIVIVVVSSGRRCNETKHQI